METVAEKRKKEELSLREEISRLKKIVDNLKSEKAELECQEALHKEEVVRNAEVDQQLENEHKLLKEECDNLKGMYNRTVQELQELAEKYHALAEEVRQHQHHKDVMCEALVMMGQGDHLEPPASPEEFDYDHSPPGTPSEHEPGYEPPEAEFHYEEYKTKVKVANLTRTKSELIEEKARIVTQ